MPDDEEIITGITGPAQNAGAPQFATAEYGHVPGTERCGLCNSLLTTQYFRVNTLMACGTCAAQAHEGQPKDSHVIFARALLLGAGASIIGMALYATVVIATGWTIGYLALAVGWLVAKAMMKGSRGIGGRRYQVAAVALTYAAISLSSIPVIISTALKEKPATQQQSGRANGGTPTTAETGSEGAQQDAKAPAAGFGAAIGMLALWGLASPFLELADPGHGLLGLVILFVGLSIAFRMTAAKPLEVDGPYSVTG